MNPLALTRFARGLAALLAAVGMLTLCLFLLVIGAHSRSTPRALASAGDPDFAHAVPGPPNFNFEASVPDDLAVYNAEFEEDNVSSDPPPNPSFEDDLEDWSVAGSAEIEESGGAGGTDQWVKVNGLSSITSDPFTPTYGSNSLRLACRRPNLLDFTSFNA
jgi:hypothetical protein